MVNLSNVYRWYRGVMPPYRADEFLNFIRSTGRFAGYVLLDFPMRKRVQVNFADSECAYCIPARYSITLPIHDLVPRVWTEMNPLFASIDPKDYAAAAIAVTTADLLHEATHIKKTPADWVRYSTHPQTQDFLAEAPRAVEAMFQYGEDLYVNNDVQKKYYGLFIPIWQGVFNNEAVYDKWAETYATAPDAGSLHWLIMSWRNDQLRDPDRWDMLPPEFQDLSYAIMDAHDKSDRITKEFELYELFRDTFKSDPNNEKLPKQGGQADGTPGGDKLTPEEWEEIKREVMKALEEIGVSIGQEDLEDLSTEVSATTHEPYPDPDDFSTDAPLPVVTDISKMVRRSGPRVHVTPAKEFDAFGRVLQTLRHKNRSIGIPREDGDRLLDTRLADVVTTRRIFSPSIQRDNRHRPQVKLSINMSGSMEYLLKQVLSAAYGTMNSLRDNNIDCTVYGHTTIDHYRDTAPYIIKIADTSQSVSVNDYFNMASQVHMATSYDGHVLLYLAEQFEQVPGQKVIIELTDGRPNANNHYTGRKAMRHVHDVVEYLRKKKNVIVLCLSLSEDVVEANDEIYGQSWNINAAHNIEKSLQRAVQDYLG